MNADNCFPISGRPDDAPAENPPIIFPKNEPIAYPIFSRIGIPSLRNFIPSSQYFCKAPNPIRKAPTPTTRRARIPKPANAEPAK